MSNILNYDIRTATESLGDRYFIPSLYSYGTTIVMFSLLLIELGTKLCMRIHTQEMKGLEKNKK